MNNTGQYINSRKNILSIYFTADFPYKGSTKDIILELQNNDIDLIELGLPFSDPLADGKTIQHSNQIALKNGFNVDDFFEDLYTIKADIKVPLILMGYFNILLSYGLKKFLKQCYNLNIDTVIIPDLPPMVYHTMYEDVFKKYNVSPVFLITPNTNEKRIKYINQLSQAFIYVVSDNSITGGQNTFSENQLRYFKQLKKMTFEVPILIGFGISNTASYHTACKYAHGVIIGSSFIRAISKDDNISENIAQFIKTIKS